MLDGPPLRGDARIQMWWVVITTTIVLFLAGYGSVRLLSDGAGGGQGPNPIAAPSQAKDPPLQVQVIAQQWQFTYRFPGYGGVETQHLDIPAHTTIAFNVTSLDVIHSFWAYQLGVKADANPGENNIAYVTTKAPLTFNIRCAELCGVWHGYMFDTGHVVTKAQFASWIAAQRREVRAGDKVAGAVLEDLLPGPPEVRRMSAIAVTTEKPPGVAAPDRLQPAHGGRARDRRLPDRLLDRRPDPRLQRRVLLVGGRSRTTSRSSSATRSAWSAS